MLCSARCATSARTKGCDACASLPPPPPPFFAHSCGPPPESRGLIYFTESLPLSPLSFLSRRRSYAPHTPGSPSFLASSRGDRKLRSVRAYTRLRASLTRVHPSPPVLSLIEIVSDAVFFNAIKGE